MSFDRGPALTGDPSLDTKLATDICKNIDLPLMAFNANHKVRL